MNERGTDAQELNVYAYVRNNPLRYNDSLGLFAIQVSTATSFGISNSPRGFKGTFREASSGFIIGSEKGSFSAKGIISAGRGDKVSGISGGVSLNVGIIYGDISTTEGAGKSETITVGPASLSFLSNSSGESIGFSLSAWGFGGGLSEQHTHTNTVLGEGIEINFNNNNSVYDVEYVYCHIALEEYVEYIKIRKAGIMNIFSKGKIIYLPMECIRDKFLCAFKKYLIEYNLIVFF